MMAPSQPRPQVVEVPVPVYVPMSAGMMMRMGRNAAVGPAAIRPRHASHAAIAVPRMMPAEHRGQVAPEPQSVQSAPGQMAVIYYHAPEGAESLPEHENMAAPVHQAEPSSAEPESPNGFVRILLRPKMSPVSPVASQLSRLSFHRRLDDSDDDNTNQIVSPRVMAVHPHAEAMIDAGARLRQWRDYSQFVRNGPFAAPQQNAPVAHLLIAAAPSSSSRNDPEPASSEDHYAQPHPAASMPFFYNHHTEPEAVANQHHQHQPHHFMMAAHPGASQIFPQTQQQQSGPGHQAAFFILAEPHGAQPDGPNNDA